MGGESRFGGQSCPLSFPVINGLEGACLIVPSVLEGAAGCCACFFSALMLWVWG